MDLPIMAKDLPENFYDKRKIGENDTEMCILIRDDSIENNVLPKRLHETK